MKKIIGLALIALAALAAGVGIYQFAQQDSYVLIGYQDSVLTTNLSFAVGVILVVLGSLFATIFVAYKVLTASNRFGLWKKERRQKHAAQQVKGALIALAEGNWQQAERQFALAADNEGNQLIAYLGAAQAANALGSNDKRDDYLRLADQNTDGADIAVGITKAALQMDRGQLEQALATLMHLRTLAPEHAYIIEMMKEAYTKLNDWEQLVLLIPELRKYKIGSKLELDELECLARSELLKRIVKAKSTSLESGERDGLSNSLIRQWESRSKALQGEVELFTVFIQCQLQIGAGRVAERELRTLLPKFWSDALVDLYGRIEDAKADEQLLVAQGWLQERPNHEVLLLALGRISVRNGQLDDAKSYFESSLKIRKSAEAYAELGRVLSLQGDLKAGNDQLMLSLVMQSQLVPVVEGGEAFKKKNLASDEKSDHSEMVETA